MSFDVLRDIKRENERAEDAATRRGPVGCPVCGNVLVLGPRGVRNCPTGDYRWGG